MRLTENQLKKIIRKTILEVSNARCNYISLGFVDSEGNFHDIEEAFCCQVPQTPVKN